MEWDSAFDFQFEHHLIQHSAKISTGIGLYLLVNEPYDLLCFVNNVYPFYYDCKLLPFLSLIPLIESSCLSDKNSLKWAYPFLRFIV